ncbi:hypothetical protein ABW20_dc0101064 [Dactylellina cionopaga]|nr:hypothetical protein ABW20_dc0101064 [Dactylellina cionopaga]
MMLDLILILSFILSASCTTSYSNNFEKRCSDIAHTFRRSHTAVLLSEFVGSGTNITNNNGPSGCYESSYTVVQTDICRLRLNVTTSATSSVIVEAWMPVQWKQNRFLMIGNSGLGGCLLYGTVALANYHGFAAVVNDNGHKGNTGVYLRNRPEVFKDYVYRAFYPNCKSSEEFDGIVAGATTNNMINLGASWEWYSKVLDLTKPGSPYPLTVDQWTMVNELINRQCDTIDGVLDKVIEDPMKCVPRPEALLCRPGHTWSSHKCLTSSQVYAIRRLYEPFYGNGGRLLYPRLQPGGEFGAIRPLTSDHPAKYLEDLFKYVIIKDDNWTLEKNLTLEAVDHANKLDPFGLSTWKSLTKLRATSHKLLTHHGLMDSLISSENSYRYYEYVSRNMRLPSSELDKFYRFFPIPGLDHCGGGTGAWYVGGTMQTVTIDMEHFKKVDPRDGVLMIMVRWVEDGVAPERIMGINLLSNGSQDAVIRDHCKYPLKNVYKGTGNPSLRENWDCK